MYLLYTKPKRSLRFAALLLLAAVAVAGCSRNEHRIEIDHRFSINVVKVPIWYPDPAMQLTPAQEEVRFRYGNPDYFHFWWRPDGSLITSSDLSGRQHLANKELETIKTTWVYLREDFEIVFTRSGGGYGTIPITEKIRLICKYGDPGEKSPPKIRDGQTHEYWRWIEHGIQIHLVDGVEIDRTTFQGTGAGTYLGK